MGFPSSRVCQLETCLNCGCIDTELTHRYAEIRVPIVAGRDRYYSLRWTNTIAERFRALNILSPHRGPHSLRHACATRLLAEGLSMKEIGDHLGHRNPDSTRVYAKVDLAGLRQVADFEMGGVL
jgi:integrase